MNISFSISFSLFNAGHPGSGNRWTCELINMATGFGTSPTRLIVSRMNVPVIHTHSQHPDMVAKPWQGAQHQALIFLY